MKKRKIGLLVAENRKETRDGLNMLVHNVTQRKNIIQDKCHKCVTRIPIMRKAGMVLVILINRVTTETKNILNILCN